MLITRPFLKELFLTIMGASSLQVVSYRPLVLNFYEA